MHAEEAEGRLEHLMATAVSRTRWMVGHLTCATLGTLFLLLLAGASAGLTHARASGETTRVSTLTFAALIQAPAVLALSGFVIAVFGLLPRWAEVLSWAALTLSVLLGPLGEILTLPHAARDIPPLSHTR